MDVYSQEPQEKFLFSPKFQNNLAALVQALFFQLFYLDFTYKGIFIKRKLRLFRAGKQL